MISKRLLWLVCLVLAIGGPAVWAAAPTRSVVLDEIPPPLVVDAKTATAQGWLLLRNQGEVDQNVRVTIGDFVSKTTGRLLGTQAELFEGSATAAVHIMERKLKPNETLAVRLVVKNLWEAGESSTSLRLNSETYTLTATAVDVPFNVTLVAGSADKPVLKFERDHRRQMVLKNDDALNYPISWKLFLPDEGKSLEGTTMLPAKSTVPIPLDPPRSWFRQFFTGLFKDDVRPGLLTVSFAPTNNTLVTPLPTRTTNVELHLAYWSENWKASIGNLIILLLLVAGGVCSLVLGMTVPNRLARIDLLQRLDAVLQEIRAVSSQIPSVLRVALRVERMRLSEAVCKQPIFSVETADQLKKFEKESDLLARRTRLASRLDEVDRQLAPLAQATSAAPPSRIDEAAVTLRKAAVLLAKTTAGEAELQAVETLLQDAAARIAGIMQEDEGFGKKLAQRLTELRDDFDGYGKGNMKPIYEEMERQLTDLFTVLKIPSLKGVTEIPVGRYHWIDTSIEKLYVLRHYILRYQDTEGDQKRHARIENVKSDLVKLLRLQNWNSLELARSLRRQCEQDVFVGDVIEELQGANARVERDPLNVYPNTPTRLRVRFNDPRFDECEARRAIRCVWNFGSKVGEETGWDIIHYFRNRYETNVKLDFYNVRGGNNQTIQQIVSPVPLQEVPGQDRWSDRTKVEYGRLVLALAVAVLALLSGAREQLLKLDLAFGLIAIFLMGVGADATKSLFAKRS